MASIDPLLTETAAAIASGTTVAPSQLSFYSRWGLHAFYLSIGIGVALPAIPTRLILMNELKCQPATMAFVLSATTLPWVIKPVYGYVSDSWPLYRRRRLPYIFLGLCMNIVSLFMMSVVGSSLGFSMFLVMMFLSSIGFALVSAIGDALTVELSKLDDNDRGILHSGTSMAHSLGSVFAALICGVGIDQLNLLAEDLLAVTAICSLVGLIGIMFIDEPVVLDGGAARGKVSVVAVCWRSVRIRRLALFVLILSSPPSMTNPMFYFMRHELHLSVEFLSFLTLVGHAAYMLASFIYRQRLRHYPLTTVVRVSIAATFATGLTSIAVVNRWNVAWGVPDSIIILLEAMLLAISVQIGSMPLTILASRLAPIGSEGTVFNALMSTWNVGLILSEAAGGFLADSFAIEADNFEFLSPYVAICIVCRLLPLLCVHLLRNDDQIEANSKSDHDKTD